MKKLFLTIITLLFCSMVAVAKPVNVLIISGQNNHNWPVSNQIIKDILTSAGYNVDIALSPKEGEDMSGFNPSFKGYKLVVLDYCGDSWCDEMKESFMQYVKSGNGVIVYHASNNAFPDWDDYESVIALGGWGGRGKNTEGYYTEWKNGRVDKYEASDKVGSHGARRDFIINNQNPYHVANAGLPKNMVQQSDELYDHMKGKANIKDVLFTAYSDPENKGTGKEEILVFTVDFGKAKIFHTMLGHAGPTVEESPAMRSEAFVKTLLGGAKWASNKAYK